MPPLACEARSLTPAPYVQVQWSDTVAALYILGHRLYIGTQIASFLTVMKTDPMATSSCPVSQSVSWNIERGQNRP